MWLEIWEREVRGLALLCETLLMQGTRTKKLHIGEGKEREGWTSPRSKTALKCIGPTCETETQTSSYTAFPYFSLVFHNWPCPS